MARPRTVSDEQILDAARRLIRTRGPHVPVEAIAAEVGVSQQAVLKRFGSRDQLLVETLRPPPTPAFFTALEQGPDRRPFIEQLTEISAAVAALISTQAQDFAALRWSSASIRDVLVPPDAPPAPLAAIQQMSAWMQRCADRGLIRQDVDTEATALALIGALQVRSLFDHLFAQPPIDADNDSYVAVVIDTFDRALRS
jgi:AcrR family transcriptional regulator